MSRSMLSHARMLGFVFFHAFMLTSTCLDVHSHAYMHIPMLICVDQCVYMLRSMFSTCFMPSFMCLGLDLFCHAICYCSPFVPFITFSCVLVYWLGPYLDPMVFVIIYTPRHTSKGIDHHICMSMLAFFYALHLC